MPKDKEKLDVSAAAKHGKATSAGTAVGVDRLGCLSISTGRFTESAACDPLFEGTATSSDMAAVGR